MTALLERARESRKSPSVLKTRLIGARSRDNDAWIFVYEGVDDIGVYDVWVRLVDSGLHFLPIPGEGKEQVLALRQNLQSNALLKYRVLYFVDHDFDGLAGQDAGHDLFCTLRYSVENYLVGKEALRSILHDEIRCAQTGEAVDPIIERFERCYSEFLVAMRDVNLRLFIARRTKVPIARIEERVRRYVTIELSRVIKSFSDDDLDRLMPVRDGHNLGDIGGALCEEFSHLDPICSYRGKFAFAFFRQWLSLIADDRRCAAPTMFGQQIASIGFSPETMSLRSLASRTAVPTEFREFLTHATAGT